MPANMVSLSFNQHRSQIAFSGPFGSYEIDQTGKFVKMAVLDCRGLEPVGLDPRVNMFLPLCHLV
jgi:hypothetical protein